jgi:hypothetical protein
MNDIRIGHVGDSNTTFGDNSPINTGGSGGQDPEELLRQLVSAVRVMRHVLPPSAHPIVNGFLEVADSPATPDKKHRLRDATLQVGAVASMLGQVGVPVIEAIDKLKAALGL